jgi:hypothetical protein
MNSFLGAANPLQPNGVYHSGDNHQEQVFLIRDNSWNSRLSLFSSAWLRLPRRRQPKGWTPNMIFQTDSHRTSGYEPVKYRPELLGVD